MDVLEFIKERERMCNSVEMCSECPAEDCECNRLDFMKDDDRIISIVEQWSKEHLHKTRQSIFLEQYPEAMISFRENILSVCPQYIDRNIKCIRERDGNCGNCRREFWMQEVE